MHFPVTILLGLHFLLCQRVSSLQQNSVLRNQILSIEKADDSLRKFFEGLGNVYLKKRNPRQIAIIGASNDHMRQAEPLIENYPHTICTDPEKCFYPKNFHSKSFFIVFLDDLGQKTLDKHSKILSGGTTDCEALFVFEGVITKRKEISNFLFRAVNHGVVHSALAHLVKDNVKVYRSFLEENCTLGAELVGESGIDNSEINSLSSKLIDMKRCPIPVGSFQYMPKMVIEEKKNGSLAIVGGRDGMLVLLIAEKLNFTVDLRYPSKYDMRNYSQKAALMKDVTSGIVEFGVSRIRPTNYSDISLSFDEECITWAVPRLTSTKNLLWVEFPWQAWILIITVFIISCASGYINDVILSGNANRRGVKIGRIILSVVSMNFGNAAMYQPISVAGKIMMITYLYYALVMTTAYKASLDSILTTVESSSTITDVSGIVEAELEVGGSRYHYEVLKDQANDSEMIPKLINRYKIYSNDSIAAERVMRGNYFAFLARRSTLNHLKQIAVKTQNLLKFNILDECVLEYPVVMVFQERSYLLPSINGVISRIRESGILDYWDRDINVSDKELEKKNADRFAAMYKRQKFEQIFLFYLACITICLVVFIIEILVARFWSKKRHAIPKRNR